MLDKPEKKAGQSMPPRYYFREWRKFRRMTQEALADRVGVSASSISQLETGKQGFTGDMLHMLALALGCHTYDLLARDPTDNSSAWAIHAKLEKAPPEKRETAIRVLSEILKP